MDIQVINHGSIFVLSGVSDAGKEWMQQHIPSDVIRWGIGGVVVEPRYVGDIVDGAVNDGLDVG